MVNDFRIFLASLFVATALPVKGGVRRHDSERSYQGYNLLTSYAADGDGCVVFSNDGSSQRTFPGDFCSFIPGTGFVTILQGKIHFYNKKMELLWARPVGHFHHAMKVDLTGKRIYILDDRVQYVPALEANVIGDRVLGYDYGGRLIFSWDFFRDRGVIKKIAPKTVFQRDQEARDLTYQSLHLNSVDVLTGNFPSMGPAFRKGNILLTSLNLHAIYIMEPSSKKVVWTYQEEGYWGGLHSARFTADGRIVYFKNGDEGGPPHSSELIVLNPLTRKAEWRYRAAVGHRFYSRRFGHVEVLPNGNFLVTDNPAGEGHAFEITWDKKIVWEWGNPRLGPNGRPQEVFQVLRVPAGDLADFM